MRLDVFFFRTKTGSLACVWWVSLTERLQTGAVSLQKPTIIWLFQDLGKLPSRLAKHRFNHKAAVILACVESVSNRVIARKRAKKRCLLPLPSHSFFVLLSSQLSRRTRAKRLLRRLRDLQWFKKTNIYIQPARKESREKGNSVLFDSYPPFRSPGRKPCSAWLIRTELNTQNYKYHEMQRLRCNHDIQVLLTKKENASARV